jgi:hypothetical protein
VVDERAASNPNANFAKIPVSSTYKDGFGTATNLQVATSIDFVANLKIPNLTEARPLRQLRTLARVIFGTPLCCSQLLKLSMNLSARSTQQPSSSYFTFESS